MRDLIRSYGIPLALYSDRHGVFKHTPPSETAAAPTQFSRAMGEIGVQLIFARSPQAKGRVERTAGTLQDRLVTEMRLAGATTIDDANRVLNDFLPRFNERFRVPPENADTAYRVPDPGMCLDTVPMPEVQAQGWTGQHGEIPLAHPAVASRQVSAELCRVGGGSTRGAGTADWQCNTKGVPSPPSKHLHGPVSCAASTRGPCTRLVPAATPTVSPGGRRTRWRQWAQCS